MMRPWNATKEWRRRMRVAVDLRLESGMTEPSKQDLRNMLAEAWRNTAAIAVDKPAEVQP